MRFPVLQNASQILTVWAQMIKAYERDFSALAPKIGQVTLTPGGTTTTLSNVALRPTTKVFFTPTTASATTAWATLRVATPTQGAVVITHANTADVDKTFDYAILGV